MVNKIVELLTSIIPMVINYFFSKTKEKKEEEKILNKQQDINFQSEVEQVVAKANNEETKDDALRRMRELLGE